MSCDSLSITEIVPRHSVQAGLYVQAVCISCETDEKFVCEQKPLAKHLNCFLEVRELYLWNGEPKWTTPCKLSLFYEKDLTITIADANSLIKVPSGNPLMS